MTCFTLFFALIGWEVVTSTELVPERYLRPRDYNHHPFTDVGENIIPKQSLQPLHDVHPYAILASKRPREGRGFAEQDGVYFPDPPKEVLPRKQPSLRGYIQPQYHAIDPYSNVPKNYAFSYSVKDKHSGDDFSHSQAHNGQATRGQYRVKLPDGRVQVVSYTADDKGYRADVQYEGEAAVYQPTATPIYEHSTAAPQAYRDEYIQSNFLQQPHLQQYDQYENHYTATPVSQGQNVFYATPSPFHGKYYEQSGGPVQHQQLFTPTPTPYADYNVGSTPDYHYEYVTQAPPRGFAPTPDTLGKNFASPSPITFPTVPPEPLPVSANSLGLSAFASPAPFESQRASGHQFEYASPTPFPGRSTPAPFHRFVSSTEAPQDVQILVAPTRRTQRNSKSEKDSSRRAFGVRQHVIYRQKLS